MLCISCFCFEGGKALKGASDAEQTIELLRKAEKRYHYNFILNRTN